MRKLNIIECTEVAGGTSGDIIYVAEVLPPLSPEKELALFMYIGTFLGGMGGFGLGTTFCSGSTALIGATTVAGSVTGLFTFPFIAYGVGNLVVNGFNSVKSFYI